MEPLAKVRDGYDRWAMVYDDDQNPLQALEGPLVQQACGNVQGLRVLDMGCGTGRHALWLAQAGAKVTGIYFSKGILKIYLDGPTLTDLLKFDLCLGWNRCNLASTVFLIENTLPIVSYLNRCPPGLATTDIAN